MTKSLFKGFILLFFLLSLKASLLCQVNKNIRFTNINNSHGLSNNSVNTIAKDDLGFIWIGTNDGLCRYEGPNELKVFRANDPQIEGGLQSSNIRSLFLDSKNNLWIGTRLGGVTKFHQLSNTWKTFRNDKNDPTSLSNDEVLTITEDSKGRIWIGTEDGVNIYNEETDGFFSFKMEDKKSGTLQAKAVLSIFEDAQGWIWVGTWEGGLNLLLLPENGKIEEGKFKTFFPNEKKQASRVWKIYQDNQHRFWLGTASGGLFLMQLPSESNNIISGQDWTPHFHNYNNEGKDHSLTHDDIKDILQDRYGNLWIATSNGLNFIAAKKLEKIPSKENDFNNYDIHFNQFFNEFNNKNSLVNDNVRTIFEDDQGIVWVGTFGGVSQYNWATNQFDIHKLPASITKNPVSQNLYVDPDGVGWFGNGEKGILKYDFAKHKKIKGTTIGLNSFVSALHSPDDKHLYIGHRIGVSVLEMKTNKRKHYPIFDASYQQQNYSIIRSIFSDRKNRIWIGTENGLFVIDEKTGVYKIFTTDSSNSKSISDNTTNQIYEDSNGDIWLATFQGLNKVVELKPNELEFEFESFKHDSKHPNNTIPSNRIVSIIELNGILYIATDIGLSGYDLKKKTFINYSKDHHKYSFQSIEKTKDNHLWGSTTEGIVYYNPTSNTFNKYEKRDGLESVAFLLRSSFMDENGWLYFGNNRGITKFDPQRIVKNEIPPPVYFTDIRKMGSNGEVFSTATYAKEIVLEHNEYYLSLDFAAINYNRPEKNKYAFMLEGFDDKWNYLDKKTSAIYTNLNHGAYRFKIKAANNDGVWNEVGATLNITKKPAFWETWYFKAGGLLATFLLLFLGVKFYTRNIKKRNIALQKYNEDLNKEIAQRKLVEAALQEQKLVLRKSNENLARSNKDLEQFAYIASHDLQEPLRVVGNFIGLLKRRYEKYFDEDAYQYIDFAIDGVSRMSNQIKSILTFSKVSQNEISYELTDMDKVIATNLHDLSHKIKEKKVQFKIDPLPQIYCDRTLIKMVFHNLLSNAIKFNKNENPLITITHHPSPKEGFWQFSVKDNGIGIHENYRVRIFEIFKRLNHRKEYEGTGIGLSLCKKIIHRHGGEIWLESKVGKGTTFYFTISMNQPQVQATVLEKKSLDYN